MLSLPHKKPPFRFLVIYMYICVCVCIHGIYVCVYISHKRHCDMLSFPIQPSLVPFLLIPLAFHRVLLTPSPNPLRVHVHACLYMCRSEKDVCVSCSIFQHLISLRQNPLLSLELSWWPASPSEPLVSAPHSAGLTGIYVGMSSFLCRYKNL